MKDNMNLYWKVDDIKPAVDWYDSKMHGSLSANNRSKSVYDHSTDEELLWSGLSKTNHHHLASVNSDSLLSTALGIPDPTTLLTRGLRT